MVLICCCWLPIFKKTAHFRSSTFAIFIMSFNEHVLFISCVGQYSDGACGPFADVTNVRGPERGLGRETGLGSEAHPRTDKPLTPRSLNPPGRKSQ